MSHEITDTDQMMYVGEVPWHGLGVKVDEENATLETALKASGLDWEVEKESLTTESGIVVPGMYATVRADTRRPLGVVGESYTPVNNGDVFNFIDDVLGGDVKVETAGSLKGQTVVWVLTHLRSREVVKGDEVKDYLLAVTSHDGSKAMAAYATSVRVVCNNTLTLSFRDKKNGVTIKHTVNVVDRMATAQKTLRRTLGLLDQQAAFEQRCAVTQMTATMWDEFLDQLIPLPEDEGRKRTRRENHRNTLTTLFESGLGQDIPGVAGTAWAALNAVTQWGTHRPTRGKSTAMESVLWGTAQRDVANATAILESMV